MEYQTQVRLSLGEVDFREAWRREAEPTNFPLVFLIGYPRSGTTLLEQIIDAHGDVCSLEETGAFLQCTRQVLTGQAPNSDFWRGINAPDAVLREQARQWYCEYLSRLGVSMNRPQVVIDKNPGLIGHVQFISRIFPHAKFLFLIRDPRDVALSAYQTPVSLTPFSVNWLNWDDTVRHCVHHLDHWVTLRNRLPNPHLEVRYEDLIADLTTTGERVMNFLGLDWRPSQARFAEHAQEKQVYSPTLYEVRKDLSPAAKGKWRQFGLDYSAGEPRLSALLKSFGYDIDHHHLNSTATSFADQNSATRSGFDAMAFPSPATQYVR